MTWIRILFTPFASVRRLLPCFFLGICLVGGDVLADFSSTDSSHLTSVDSNVKKVLRQLNGEGGAYSLPFYLDTTLPQIQRIMDAAEGLDQTWLKLFVTGRPDGDVTQSPWFRYAGTSETGTIASQQNLQNFLGRVLGQFYWNDSDRTFEGAWQAGDVPTAGQHLGNQYSYFSIWLAEAMRRLISTNQLIATTHDRNTRSIEENLSLILTQLRDMTNSVSVSSPEVSVTVSPVVDIPAVNITNEVTIAADYSPSMPDPSLTNVSGEVTAASYVAPDTDAFVNEDMRFTRDLGDPVLTLWEGVRLGDVSIPDAKIDFNSSEHGAAIRHASEVLRNISISIWWLLYYIALGVLLRREYVYYTSLGHTEGAA